MQPTKAKGGAAAMSSSHADDGASSGGKASGAGGAMDELPLHLTEKILQSFSPLASARLATVCKSWATAVSDRLARPVPHLFVYLPADITKSDRRGIVVSVSLDLDSGRCTPAATVIPNRVLLKDTNGLRCIGAMPSGCLAFENPWLCDTRVLLVNPITGALQRVDVDKLRRNPVIAAGGAADSFVCHGPGPLELWRRAGAGEWSKLPVAAAALRTDGIVSVANCDGRFYILDRDGEVSVIDAAAPPPLRVEKLPVASLFGHFAGRPCPAADAPVAQGNLLEYDGEVLFVRRVLGSSKKAGGGVDAFCSHDGAEADELLTLTVVGFEVYRLDVGERRWKEVRKLGTNRSLFVSPRSAFAVRSSETEGCRSNCIYFVDKKRYCGLCNLDVGNTWGVYSMEDRQVLFKHAVTGKGPCSEATWFLPRVG